MAEKPTNEKVRFRLLQTPCCHALICWVNPRLPNFCPECGERIYARMKRGSYSAMDSDAWLKIMNPEQHPIVPAPA